VPKTTFNIALLGGFYIAIIMDSYRGPQTALTIAFACRPLLSHYNEQL
jgi:hypothetical protein